MSELQSPSLRELEHFLRISVEANYWLTFADVNPVAVVEEIQEQLMDRRFEWLDGAIYVPNLLTVFVVEPTPEKLEELEVLFNSMVFTKYLYEHITESGFKLFDFMRIEIKVAPTDQQQFAGPCYLYFDWPNANDSTEQVTVKYDLQERKILELCEPKPDIPRLARLTALNAEVYRNQYTITRPSVSIGRLRNVIDKHTGQVLRRNDFVFARQQVPDSPNASVSRQHGRISFEDGEFFFYDTGSVNGSAIERAGMTIPVATSTNFLQRVQLHDHDIITLGAARILFEMIHSPEEIGRLQTSGETTQERTDSLYDLEGLETLRVFPKDLA